MVLTMIDVSGTVDGESLRAFLTEVDMIKRAEEAAREAKELGALTPLAPLTAPERSKPRI